MQLSFLNEFTYFSNDEAIDRVVTKDGVRFVKLKDDEKPYGLNELIQNISSEMFIVSDLHIGDPIDNWTDKRDKIISTINNIVGKNDKLLILGDLTAHSNTTNIYDVVNFIKCLKCENLYLVLGNNDIYSIDSYKRMGFKAVVDKVIWRNYIFTHMPIWVTGKEINIHGHLHEEIRYENVDWHNHIRIWDDEYKPIKFREVLTRFESGYYKGVTMTSAELNAEYEMKQKVEEINYAISTVFYEIERLNETFSLASNMKNVFSGDLSKPCIPLYESNFIKYEDGSSKYNKLYEDWDTQYCYSLSYSPIYNKATRAENSLNFSQTSILDVLHDKINTILTRNSTDLIKFELTDGSSNAEFVISANIPSSICESLTVMTGKDVSIRFAQNNKFYRVDTVMLSRNYMESTVKSLYTYDYTFDNNLLHNALDAVKMYDDYVEGTIDKFINADYDDNTRQIDHMMYDNIKTMLIANIPRDKIIQTIKDDYFSDHGSQEEILTNASYRLHHFATTLKFIRTALLFNVTAIDDDIYHLINFKPAPEMKQQIWNEYEHYVPKLSDNEYVLKVKNGGQIIISQDYFNDNLINADRVTQVSLLVNPVWYAMNGYDIVILGHGLTQNEFNIKYGRPINSENDDFYMQPIVYQGKQFNTLNSILNYIHKNWKSDNECKIMVLVCNEEPHRSLNKLIKTYNSKEFNNIDVSVSRSRIMVEFKDYSDIGDLQKLYNNTISYCEYLVHDIETVRQALIARFKVLKSLNILSFYHIGKRINVKTATCESHVFTTYEQLYNESMELYNQFASQIGLTININSCYLVNVKNYIWYTDEEPNFNKVAFNGIAMNVPNLTINEYSNCLNTKYNDTIINETMSTEQKYIYVSTFKYKSFFGTIVRAATLSNYNHATISLNEHLSPMYTYVREMPRAKCKYNNKNGFSHEFLSDMLQKDPDCIVKVIAIPVDDEQYETAEALIKGYEENIEDTSYDFGNIVASFFKVKRNVYNLPEMDMVCSEFVAYILYSIGFRGMSKSVNLTTPKDISQLDKKFIGAKCIYEGKVKDYKK